MGNKSKQKFVIEGYTPFYKKTSFYVCISLIALFITGAIIATVFIGLRWTYYTNVINQVNAAFSSIPNPSQQTFQVMINNTPLGYYTTHGTVSDNFININGVKYYWSTTFYVADFVGNIDSSDLEVWMYMTKTPEYLVNLHKNNLSFLVNLYGSNTLTINTVLYVFSPICWILGFIFLIPIIVMGISHLKFVKEEEHKAKKQANIGVEEYLEAETQTDHTSIEKSINKELNA